MITAFFLLMRRIIVFGLLLMLGVGLQAQSLTGTRGLMKAPAARMYPDNTLVLGASYIPSGIFKRTYGQYQGVVTGNAGLNTFVTVNFLPFVEVMFRYSHEYNMKVQPTNRYFPDRMFTARVRLIDEQGNRPAVLVGLQDVSAAFDLTCKGCSNYSAAYVVTSKEFAYRGYRVDASLGYSGDFKGMEAKDFRGLFGGVEVFTPYAENMSFLWDYDSQFMNVGINCYFFKRFHVTLGLLDMSKYTWILAYRYQI